jgi:hypothetical protein
MKNKWQICWFVLLIVGILSWISVFIWGDTQRAFRLLFVNFLYFSSLGAGLVVWPAAIIASRGTWMKRLNLTAYSAIGFGPLILLGIILVFIGAKYWALWMGHEPKIAAWLNLPFMASRDIIAIIIFLILAGLFVYKKSNQTRKFSGWLIFIFSIVFSLIGFDLIMPLQKSWISALFGGYFFISAFYIAIAGWCLLSIIQGTIDDKEQLADIGKLILTFCMLTTYFLFSQLFVIWYENLPPETSFLIPRMNITHWPWISIALLIMVYLGPIALLIWKNLKYSKIYMTFVSLFILTGMWIERWWLVMPGLGEKLKFGLSEFTSLLLFISAFAISITIGKKILINHEL